MCVCVCVCLYVFIQKRVYLSLYPSLAYIHTCTYVYMYIDIHIYIYVCVYIYIYIHMYICIDRQLVETLPTLCWNYAGAMANSYIRYFASSMLECVHCQFYPVCVVGGLVTAPVFERSGGTVGKVDIRIFHVGSAPCPRLPPANPCSDPMTSHGGFSIVQGRVSLLLRIYYSYYYEWAIRHNRLLHTLSPCPRARPANLSWAPCSRAPPSHERRFGTTALRQSTWTRPRRGKSSDVFSSRLRFWLLLENSYECLPLRPNNE